MADFTVIPVVEVQNNNFNELWPTLILGLKTATFVALDLELSGLGERGKLFARAIEDRYKGMCDIARSHSVVSLGLSFFRLVDQESKTAEEHQFASKSPACRPALKGTGLKFVVQTYNIMLLCSQSYVVEPSSLKFLIEHGFDFNKQYATGLSYYRGNDREQKETISIRHLIADIVRQAVPVVFHNGLVDLVFLYQNFYAETPANMPTFLADLSEIFSGGVYDTKYIAEFKARYPSSFLQYVFRKCQRDNYNLSMSGNRHAQVSTLSYPTSYEHVQYMTCGIKDMSSQKHINVCNNYANHGWCSHGSSCPLSHDVDLALDNENITVETKKKKRNRRKKCKLTEYEKTDDQVESMDTSDGKLDSVVTEPGDQEPKDPADMDTCKDNQEKEPCTEKSNSPQADGNSNGDTQRNSGGHRAGFDAFMTGFIFAHFIAKYGSKDLPPNSSLKDFNIEEFTNKICLGGKDIPLQVMKSGFAKNSKDHKFKYEKIKKDKE